MTNPPELTGVAADATTTGDNASRSMGELLFASGRLKREDIARVEHRRLAAKSGFGEAAVELGLLSVDEIRLVLARQHRSRNALSILPGVSPELVCAVRPDHPLASAVYRIRAALLLAHKGKAGPLMVAIVGCERGEGRTLLAANLAIAFAQVHARTVLVDADLRNGRMHTLFEVGNEVGLAAVLAGQAEIGTGVPVLHHNLSVLPAGAASDAHEMLSPGAIKSVLARLAVGTDVLVVDTPAWSLGADSQLIAAETGVALLVTRLHRTSKPDVQALVKALRSNGTTTLAVPFA